MGVVTLVYSPDGSTLALSAVDGAVYLLDVLDAYQLRHTFSTLSSLGGYISSLEFSADGTSDLFLLFINRVLGG